MIFVTLDRAVHPVVVGGNWHQSNSPMTNFSSIEYFESAMVNMIQEYRLLQEQLRESQVARDKLERTLRMERKRFQSFENSQVKELQKRAKHLESQIVECKKKNVLLEMELKSSSGAFNARNSNMYEFAYQLNQGETIERLRKLQNFQKQKKTAPTPTPLRPP